MNYENACLLEKELNSVPKLDHVKLQFVPKHNDFGYV
jgi:hypothetical protein